MAEENKPVVINTSSSKGGGVVGLIVGVGAAVGIGYVGNKIYLSMKDASDKKKQSDAATHSDDPDYQTADGMASLLNVYIALTPAEKKKYVALYSQVKDAKKVREYYTVITKGRSLDDDVKKYVTEGNVTNAQTQQTANSDGLSTWKTDKSGNVYSTVKAGDLITIKKGNAYFKWFKYIGSASAPDYTAISKNINNLFATGGDKTIKFTANLYVGNHIFNQTVYFKDSGGVNRAQQKVFAYVYGANGAYWGYVDLFEFQLVKPFAGLNGFFGTGETLSLMMC